MNPKTKEVLDDAMAKSDDPYEIFAEMRDRLDQEQWAAFCKELCEFVQAQQRA